MSVEWYAPVVTLAGVGLWIWGSLLDSVIAMLFFTLFGGGAALIIGHATILPSSLALVFVLAHLLLTMFRRSDHVNLGLRANNFLAMYCVYGALTAFILPKIFVKAVSVSPLAGIGGGDLYLTSPLHFSSQNITTAAYLIATLIASVAAAAAAVDAKSRRNLVLWAVVISWVHVFFGVAGAFLADHGGAEIVKVFRNATYAELVQDEGGLTRISGVFPEPSAYAGFAFGWFVFMAELWLRDISPRATMATAVALGVVLIACTSSTGYASLAVYVLIMLMRTVIAPQSFRVSKAIPVVMIGLAMTCVVLLACALLPHLAFTFGRVLEKLTVGKADTASGRQRLFWAATGLKAIRATWGLGIGAGSFRSSSLLIAILGSTGLIGFLAFAAHGVKILKPLRRDTYRLPGDPANAVGVAAAWSACAGLIPAMLSSPTPDPGFVFAIMGGLALGWRQQPRSAEVRSKKAASPVRWGPSARARGA